MCSLCYRKWIFKYLLHKLRMCRPYHGKSPTVRWHLILEARIRFRIIRCKVCSGISGIRTRFVLTAAVLPCQCQSTPSKLSFIYILPLTQGQNFLSLFHSLLWVKNLSINDQLDALYYRSQWTRGLRRRSAAARLLRSWVRIPTEAWIFVCCECCVLLGRGLCDELITRLEESYRLWCVVVCDLETSRMRRPWPALGRSATEKRDYTMVLS